MSQQSTILTAQRIILNPKQIKNKITVNCTFCQKEFQVWKSKYKKAQQKFNGHLYCSRDCSRKNQPDLYDKFFWCPNCKWIPQNKTILRLKGTLRQYTNTGFFRSKKPYYTKKDNYHCPMCSEILRTKQPRKNK